MVDGRWDWGVDAQPNPQAGPLVRQPDPHPEGLCAHAGTMEGFSRQLLVVEDIIGTVSGGGGGGAGATGANAGPGGEAAAAGGGAVPGTLAGGGGGGGGGSQAGGPLTEAFDGPASGPL